MGALKPKIAILTSLTDFSAAYSLTGIIADQAKMLGRAGYDYDLLALRYFNTSDAEQARAQGIRLRTEIAKANLHDYGVGEPPHEDFERQVQVHLDGDDTGKGYLELLEPYDVIITHDLMFLSWYLPQNKAIRACAERWPSKRWLHWCHSGPSGHQPGACYPSTLRYQGCPNSTYVYLNHTQRQDLANTMRINRDDVAVVYNPKDVRDLFGFCRETCDLIDEFHLLDHQVLQVYPFSTPRWGAKGVRQLFAIWGAWKDMGIRAKLVLVNAHCTQQKDVEQVVAMEEKARACGLWPGVDVVWTSRFHEQVRSTADGERFKDWDYSVPGRVVRELAQLSNTFVFPTVSECCSLIQAEASVGGKFVVLNENFLALREFADGTCLHYRFTQEDPEANPLYYRAVAREVWADMSLNPQFMNTTIARTRTYNRDWIWRNQLEPLLYKGLAKKG